MRTVNLAPALLISVQVLMGTIFGLLGLIMAAPLTVVAMVLVKNLYLEDRGEENSFLTSEAPHLLIPASLQ